MFRDQMDNPVFNSRTIIPCGKIDNDMSERLEELVIRLFQINYIESIHYFVAVELLHPQPRPDEVHRDGRRRRRRRAPVFRAKEILVSSTSLFARRFLLLYSEALPDSDFCVTY